MNTQKKSNNYTFTTKCCIANFRARLNIIRVTNSNMVDTNQHVLLLGDNCNLLEKSILNSFVLPINIIQPSLVNEAEAHIVGDQATKEYSRI